MRFETALHDVVVIQIMDYGSEHSSSFQSLSIDSLFFALQLAIRWSFAAN